MARTTPGAGAAGANRRIEAIITEEMRAGSTRFQRSMLHRLAGPTGPETLSKRTGQLARSVRSEIQRLPDRVRLRLSIGANAPYAIVHEEGRTITAKKSKYLHFVVSGHHVMKKSVTIPPRLNFRRDARRALQDTANKIRARVNALTKGGR